MPTEARRRAFRKRWNIRFDEEQEFIRFRNRLLIELMPVIGRVGFTDTLPMLDDRFSFLFGTPRYDRGFGWPDPLRDQFVQTNLYQCIDSTENPLQLIEAMQAMLWAIEEHASHVLEPAVEAVRIAIGYSPTIDIRIMLRQGQATLYPAGARLLDEALVNDTLVWLEEYPTVAKHFDEALQIYLHQDTAKYRNLLDNLRFSMEQLLRSVLHNRKSLENQKEPLLSWLNDHGTHQQIINMYQTLIAQFAQYQNDAVKHGEAFSPAEIEFIIYLTGAFMRFVLQLHEESQTAPPVEK